MHIINPLMTNGLGVGDTHLEITCNYKIGNLNRCHTIAYKDTKGTSRVRSTYVSIRSSYSSIRSSYSSYAQVLRFFMCALKNS